MFAVYRAYLQRQGTARDTAGGASLPRGCSACGGVVGVDPERERVTHRECPRADVPQRPMDMYHKEATTVLEAAGLSADTPRKAWPKEVLLRTVQSLVVRTPKYVLRSLVRSLADDFPGGSWLERPKPAAHRAFGPLV